MERLDKFYKKINDNYFGIISFLVSAVSITIADPMENLNLNSLRKGIIAGLIGSIGMILVGVFPMGPNNDFSYTMHIISDRYLYRSLNHTTQNKIYKET